MERKHKLRLTTIILSLMFLTTNAFALHHYTPLEGDQPHRGTTSAPFDGGLSLLIAAGVGYASKKGYDKRKKQKESQNQQK
jgi:hypothetical protein